MIDFLSTITLSDKVINMMVDILGGQGDQRGHRPRSPPQPPPQRPPLQVGFMLRALLSRYHAVVQEFRLGCHSLTDASLQTVVEQCTNYNKDPWKGPVGKDGKLPPRGNPSANAAGADSGDPYDALSKKSFNYHFGCWKKAFKTKDGKCMICFGLARNPDHITCDCPILKNLGLKIEKQTGSDN